MAKTDENKAATLEDLMRARLAEPRAMIGALSINANRILLTFGDVGENARVVLHIEGDDVNILHRPEAAEEDEDHEDDMLLGSNVLPSMVEIAPGMEVQLGAVVMRSHKESGLSVADWNALAEDEREAKLAATVEAMKAEEAAKPVNPAKHSKDELLAIAANTPNAVFEQSMTKAELADAINAAKQK